jgi:hypothetical protein
VVPVSVMRSTKEADRFPSIACALAAAARRCEGGRRSR